MTAGQKYLVFAGDLYYPCGGIEDFVAEFDTIEEAQSAQIDKREFCWAHIVDKTTMKEVFSLTSGDWVATENEE